MSLPARKCPAKGRAHRNQGCGGAADAHLGAAHPTGSSNGCKPPAHHHKTAPGGRARRGQATARDDTNARRTPTWHLIATRLPLLGAWCPCWRRAATAERRAQQPHRAGSRTHTLRRARCLPGRDGRRRAARAAVVGGAVPRDGGQRPRRRVAAPRVTPQRCVDPLPSNAARLCAPRHTLRVACARSVYQHCNTRACASSCCCAPALVPLTPLRHAPR